MNDNELSLIFGKSAIWDFYVNNEHMESLNYDSHNHFITCKGNIYCISNIEICMESGVLTFDKKVPDLEAARATLVFIKDKSILVGFEGTKQVKYMKTGKKSFD